MKKYAVFKNTEFVPEYELSVSLKIIESENVMTILDIVRSWVHSINPNVIVYSKGNEVKIDMFAIERPFSPDRVDKSALVVIPMPSNVRFRLGYYNTKYTTREVLGQMSNPLTPPTPHNHTIFLETARTT